VNKRKVEQQYRGSRVRLGIAGGKESSGGGLEDEKLRGIGKFGGGGWGWGGRSGRRGGVGDRRKASTEGK